MLRTRFHNILAVLSLALTALSCAPSDGCENVEMERVLPPGGDWSAVVFARSCGATTGFSTQVSVIAEGSMPRAGGNVFSADTDHGRAPSDSVGGPVVRVAWRGVDTLVVRHHPKARVFLSESRALSVLCSIYLWPGRKKIRRNEQNPEVMPKSY